MPQTGELLRGGVIRLMANIVVRCLLLHSCGPDVTQGGCVMVTLHPAQHNQQSRHSVFGYQAHTDLLTPDINKTFSSTQLRCFLRLEAARPSGWKSQWMNCLWSSLQFLSHQQPHWMSFQKPFSSLFGSDFRNTSCANHTDTPRCTGLLPCEHFS